MIFWLALSTLLLNLLVAFILLNGVRRLRSLSDFPPGDPKQLPFLSIVVAARNEERNIREAITSLMKLDYPRYEVTVVNDRSEDRTGEYLEELRKRFPRLQVVTITELPDGWLGKNHALQHGADAAHGEWLLFTDADVVLAPDTLRRAVAMAISEKLDHLVLGPSLPVPGVLLPMAVSFFGMIFNLSMRPWEVRDPKSNRFVGIGAFNLVRADAYRTCGTHKAIALRPDDDIKLGKIIKRAGLRQELVLAFNQVKVEWYRTVPEMVHGLTKNMFPGAEYSLATVIVATGYLLGAIVWPFVGAFVHTGPTRWLCATSAVLLLLVNIAHALGSSLRWWCGLGIPFSATLLTFIFWKSTLTTLITGGIRWRGTFYPLDRLKSNRV